MTLFYFENPIVHAIGFFYDNAKITDMGLSVASLFSKMFMCLVPFGRVYDGTKL